MTSKGNDTSQFGGGNAVQGRMLAISTALSTGMAYLSRWDTPLTYSFLTFQLPGSTWDEPVVPYPTLEGY